MNQIMIADAGEEFGIERLGDLFLREGPSDPVLLANVGADVPGVRIGVPALVGQERGELLAPLLIAKHIEAGWRNGLQHRRYPLADRSRFAVTVLITLLRRSRHFGESRIAHLFPPEPPTKTTLAEMSSRQGSGQRG